jgi:hypothetical protein
MVPVTFILIYAELLLFFAYQEGLFMKKLISFAKNPDSFAKIPISFAKNPNSFAKANSFSIMGANKCSLVKHPQLTHQNNKKSMNSITNSCKMLL